MPDPNKIYYGIKNLYFFEYNVDPETGVVTFGTPYHQESARNFGPDQDSNFEDIDADDTIWHTDATEGPITGDIEVVRFDDDFKVRFMGYVRTTAGGLGKPINPVKPQVCVAFEYSGDKENRREVLYNVALGNITREFETTTRESKNVKYDTLNIRAIGDKASGLYHEVFKPGDQGYNALFTQPIVPTIATSGE